MLYSQYDKKWSTIEHNYGNVYEVNSFNELTENEVREKRLYRDIKLFARQYFRERDM